jgi:nicotinamide-nucleotide amidase
VSEALSAVIPPEMEALVRRVLKRAHDLELGLATAESCTGGLLASLLTDLPGCSHVFERGFVVYTNEAKHELLGVPQEVLDGPGAVSRECAEAMATGAIEHSHADLAVSITGYAEDGPEPGQKAGLVHLACASKQGVVCHHQYEFGDIGRARLRIACLEAGLRQFEHAMDQIGEKAA